MAVAIDMYECPQLKAWSTIALQHPPLPFGSTARAEALKALQTMVQESSDQLELAKQLALLSPIRLIPDELLGRIFTYAAEQFHSECNTTQTFSQVSQHWRKVAFATPTVWMSIVVSDIEVSYLPEEALFEWFARSKNALLDVIYWTDQDGSEPTALLGRMLNHFPRTRALLFEAGDLTHETGKRFWKSITNGPLKDLTLQEVYGWTPEWNKAWNANGNLPLEDSEGVYFPPILPSLRSLTLVHTFVPVDASRLHAIELRSASVSLAQLSYLSKSSPNLSSFSAADCNDVDATGYESAIITISKLIELKTKTNLERTRDPQPTFEGIFPMIRGSTSLSTLTLVLDRAAFRFKLNIVFPTLTKFDLTMLAMEHNEQVCTEDEIKGWLKSMPMLKFLSLWSKRKMFEWGEAGRALKLATCTPILKALHLPVGEEAPYCPHLRELNIASCVCERDVVIRFSQERSPPASSLPSDTWTYDACRLTVTDCPDMPVVHDVDISELKTALETPSLSNSS